MVTCAPTFRLSHAVFAASPDLYGQPAARRAHGHRARPCPDGACPMSAVVAPGRRAHLRLRRGLIGPLAPSAWLYWLAVVAPAAFGIPFAAMQVPTTDWRRFALLVGLASAAQLLSFHLNRRRIFHPAILFVVAGALLLPPELLILLVVIHCVPDWFKQRYPWYIAVFNIANYVVSGVAAWAAAQAVGFPGPAGREAAA